MKRPAKRKAPFRKEKRDRSPKEPPQKAAPLVQTVVGVVVKTRWGWSLEVTDRKDKTRYILRNPDKATSLAGELITARLLPSTKGGKQEVEIGQTLGDPNDPKTITLAAIYQNEIPLLFPDEALAEAEAARPVALKGRTDLRDIPLITIDGADARDFDDAVFAESDGKKGWHLIVAIADVAHYVQTGSALDREAYHRGNSTYFPDTVVPMLPEALSNELCSLKPQVDRACMAVHMWIDSKGELTRWKFERGLMRSHARLTYEQVQAAHDGSPDKMTAPLVETVIAPLYEAYACLMSARLQRGTLELELPERKVNLDKNNNVKSITMRERLESHKLIEEFMICANVAAAVQLEGKGGVCLYRVHDKPTEIKLESLRDFLDSIGIKLVPARQLHPRLLTQILENAAGGEHAQIINEVMLRSQAQAVYSPENIGHFGLALAKYAHFTSPIRRYADLIIHRALIRVCNLGSGGLTDEELKKLDTIGDHLSKTERRSATAERDVVDRFTTLFLLEKIGATFNARISGVARFGLFARLDETGADGIIPFNALPRDYYIYDEKRQALVGERNGRVYRLADPVTVKLDTADRLTGSMSFSIIEPKASLPRKKKASLSTRKKLR
ncbi:MAG: ribonuclease R [Bdellovibrionales bacterium]